MDLMRQGVTLLLIIGVLTVGCVGKSSTPTQQPVALSQLPPAKIRPDPSPTATMLPLRPSRTATHTPEPSATATETPTPSAVPPTSTPTCNEVRGQIQVGTFFSAIIGREQPFRVYLPPCYEGGYERYPVLYMLHGYPFDDSHWDDIGIDEAADAGIARGTVPRLIIAMPAADNEGTYTRTSGGPRSFEAVLLDEFIPFIESNYRAVARSEARAVGGMSRGAVWSLEIAFRNPGRFAAVGGHSNTLSVNLASPAYDPLHLASDPAIRSLRIYLDAGRDDWYLPGTEDLHAALVAVGVEHEYNIYEGSHQDSYWSAHVDDYLAFYSAMW